MTQFEDKFMKIQIDMVSLAMEYVQNQADKIFIYCVADGFYALMYFLKLIIIIWIEMRLRVTFLMK